MMLRTTSVGLIVLLSVSTQLLHAQVGGAPRGVGGGVAGSAAQGRGATAGLSQTGQTAGDAIIQQSRQTFVGSPGSGQSNPRSLGGGSRTGAMGGMGMGGMGMGGMGMMGGMGGMGGMLGGLGMGRGMGMMGGMGAMGGRGGFGMMNQQGMMGGMGGMQQSRMIRTPLRIGGGVIRAPLGPRVDGFQTRLTRIPSVRNAEHVQVTMDGSVVVLQGAVATERDRELVARLLMLEPGVRDVRNELVVAPDLQP